MAPKVYVLLLRQDDPRKCTAAKLSKFGLAKPLHRLRQVPSESIVLNPLASELLLPHDRSVIVKSGVVVVDCSWERADNVLTLRMPGRGRRLPTLLAANPTNYSKAHKLSSAEALAATMHIVGFKQEAIKLLSLFSWGKTFLTLNAEPLEAYSQVQNVDEMQVTEADFF
jgi:pre-rRNA-processing protein TSR3